ncbi:MAG: PH domain-containing protein [Saprospiraceae bacterium]
MSNKETENILFNNQQVFRDNMPQLATLEYAPMEPNLLKSNLILGGLFFIIPMVVLTVFRLIVKADWSMEYGMILYAIICGLLLLTLVYIYFAFSCKNYALRQKDLIFNSGLFWKTSTVVPFNRVQHCEVSQGPIDRFFNLAQLKVYTAGGSSSDLSIEGLSPENAHRIKDFIVSKTSQDEEE